MPFLVPRIDFILSLNLFMEMTDPWNNLMTRCLIDQTVPVASRMVVNAVYPQHSRGHNLERAMMGSLVSSYMDAYMTQILLGNSLNNLNRISVTRIEQPQPVPRWGLKPESKPKEDSKLPSYKQEDPNPPPGYQN
jgi:hypothetical protein